MTPLTPTPSTASLSGVARCWDSNAYFSLFFAIFLRPTEQICPDSAGPFIVSILLALLFSLFWGARQRKSNNFAPELLQLAEEQAKDLNEAYANAMRTCRHGTPDVAAAGRAAALNAQRPQRYRCRARPPDQVTAHVT